MLLSVTEHYQNIFLMFKNLFYINPVQFLRSPFLSALPFQCLWLIGAWTYLEYILKYTYISEKAMAPHSGTLAWKIPWTEEPGGLQSTLSLRVGHDWATSLSRIGEGNDNPLQCSCLENPRDGGAWWAAISGVTQTWTRLKWLSSSILTYLVVKWLK